MAIILDGNIGVTYPDVTTQNTSAVVNGKLPTARLPAGSVLQVIQSVKTDTITFDLASGAIGSDAMTASIIPTSSTSKILVMFNGSVGNENTAGVYGYLYKNGSVVSGLTGDSAGSRQRVAAATRISEPASGQTLNFVYLDSPATTSSITYSLRLGHASGEARFISLNKSHTDTNANYGWRSASTIILMEIAA